MNVLNPVLFMSTANSGSGCPMAIVVSLPANNIGGGVTVTEIISSASELHPLASVTARA